MNPDLVDEIRVVYNLHHNIWGEELIEPPFRFYYERVLHPRERQVVDFKIAGLTNAEIAAKMGVSWKTVQRYTYNIRHIYRNKCRDRVYDKSWIFRERLKMIKYLYPKTRTQPKDSSETPASPV